MKEFKGTKGKWEVDFIYAQVRFDKNEVKDCDLYTHQYDDESEMQANAKLIAAAPDLLDALLKVKKILKKEWHKEEWIDFDGEIGYTKAISKALD